MFSQFVSFIHVVCGFLVNVFQLFFTGSSSWGLDVNQIRAFYVFIGILCVAWTRIYWEAIPRSWGFFLAMLVWTLGFAPAWEVTVLLFLPHRVIMPCAIYFNFLQGRWMVDWRHSGCMKPNETTGSCLQRGKDIRWHVVRVPRCCAAFAQAAWRPRRFVALHVQAFRPNV